MFTALCRSRFFKYPEKWLHANQSNGLFPQLAQVAFEAAAQLNIKLFVMVPNLRVGEVARLARGYKGTNSTRLHGFTYLSFVNDIVNPEGNARFIQSAWRTVPPFPRSFYLRRGYVTE